MDLQKNEDGSVDIYCGPQAPAGFEKNWIATVPGKNWFAYFRFYQPTEALLRSVLAVAGLRADIDANARHVLGLRTVSESGLGYSSVRSQPVVARGRRWWWRVAPSVCGVGRRRVIRFDAQGLGTGDALVAMHRLV